MMEVCKKSVIQSSHALMDQRVKETSIASDTSLKMCDCVWYEQVHSDKDVSEVDILGHIGTSWDIGCV